MNQTKVTLVGFAGALTTIFMALLGYFAPEFVNAMPKGFEAAITTIVMGVVGASVPYKPEGML